MARAKLIMQGPSIQVIMRQAVKEFMPIASQKLYLKAIWKLGYYQPGWDKLAASTLRKKRKRLKGKRFGNLNPTGRLLMTGGSDNPLIDTGKMRKSFKKSNTSNTASVSAGFPMAQHEQDAEVGAFRLPAQSFKQSIDSLPARPVLGPTLKEMIDPITNELMAFVGSRL